MRRIYIVLSTDRIGGAEKRFTDNWNQLRESGLDIHLVIDRRTHAGLLLQPGYDRMLATDDHLHVLDGLAGGRHVDYCKSVWRFFDDKAKRAIVHFPLAHVPGLHWRNGHRIVVSWVNSAMPPFRNGQWRLGLGAWLGLLSADHVDVLNPDNLKRINRVPGMGSKTTLTAGGTQVDTAVYRPETKASDFVFLGRVEPEKQALRFVSTLPEVHRRLEAAGHTGHRFVICGDGKEATAIRALIESEEFAGKVPIEFSFSTNPERVLGRAEVYFSLQRTSNYPSKALAEAMACGAYPVMTAVGETELMVKGMPHHAMVPRDFNADDLASVLLRWLSFSPKSRATWSEEIAGYAATRFARGQQAHYFSEIYRNLGGDL